MTDESPSKTDSRPAPDSNEAPRSPHWVISLLLCNLIAVGAAGALFVIFSTEPKAQREGASRKTAMLVETLTVQRGEFRPSIKVLGRVAATNTLELQAEVSGRVAERAPAFERGGMVARGETLLRIDPSEFEAVLAQRLSELHQAEAELQQEMGRQRVAQRDYELLGRQLEESERALILRAPQLTSAKAKVEAAQAAIARAKLDIARTTLVAPFDAQVISRDVSVGSQVSPGETLGHLVCVERYWVVAMVPLRKLARIELPPPGAPPSGEVVLRDRTAWTAGATRTGKIAGLQGSLEERTRLASLLVAVDDPLGRSPAGGGDGDVQAPPPLIIGAVLDVQIAARPIDAVRLPRDYLRKGDTVWVDEDGTLRIRRVDVAFLDADHAYITDGLADGDQVVTTNLSTVVDGAALRKANEAPADAAKAGS